MWSALVVDVWGSVPAHQSTAATLSAPNSEVPVTEASAVVNGPAGSQNGNAQDGAAIKRLTLLELLLAIIVWALSKVRGVEGGLHFAPTHIVCPALPSVQTGSPSGT